MRKNIVRSLLALTVSAAAFSAAAQPAIPREYVEMPGFSMGVNFGMTDLWGDIGTQGIIDHYGNSEYWDKPCFMGGMFGRYLGHPMLAARFGINYGTLYANDNWNTSKAEKATSTEEDAFQRYLRNQDVRANIWEATFMVEFNPLRGNSESKAAQKRMQPYILAGVGGFHFKPQSSLYNPVTGRRKWVDVHDLHLEGEGQTPTGEAMAGYASKTSLWQVCVPLGLGVRWDIGDQYALGVEYLYRLTFTDRLDNVSAQYATHDYFDRYLPPEKAAVAKALSDKSWEIAPGVQRQPWANRGNKEVNDGYSSISISFIYKILNNKSPWWF
ncbi:MAG: hypothetical protein K0R82_2045 [Flavipsychrobacter sp.]|jgi:opacity protein-like surface antigen|nr:hypothetical protein [Flavipsychrobacter sp.]